MSERSLTRRILKALNTTPLCKAIKVHGGVYQEVGTPDIIGCCRGAFFAIEVKDGAPPLSKMQKRRGKEWKSAGGCVTVVRSWDEFTVWWCVWSTEKEVCECGTR